MLSSMKKMVLNCSIKNIPFLGGHRPVPSFINPPNNDFSYQVIHEKISFKKEKKYLYELRYRAKKNAMLL